jgi:hypothetical protein
MLNLLELEKYQPQPQSFPHHQTFLFKKEFLMRNQCYGKGTKIKFLENPYCKITKATD